VLFFLCFVVVCCFGVCFLVGFFFVFLFGFGVGGFDGWLGWWGGFVLSGEEVVLWLVLVYGVVCFLFMFGFVWWFCWV